MKNLFVLMFVGLCSQGFCMDMELASNAENQVRTQEQIFPNICSDYDKIVIINRFIDYCCEHDIAVTPVAEEPYIVLKRARELGLRVNAVDVADLASIGYRSLAEGSERPFLAGATISHDDVMKRIKNIYELSNRLNISLWSSKLLGLTNDRLRSIYLEQYKKMRHGLELLEYVVDMVGDDHIRQKVFSLLDKVVRQSCAQCQLLSIRLKRRM